MLNENFPVCGKTLFARWQTTRAVSPRLARH
jgi:hypothetical protein